MDVMAVSAGTSRCDSSILPNAPSISFVIVGRRRDKMRKAGVGRAQRKKGTARVIVNKRPPSPDFVFFSVCPSVRSIVVLFCVFCRTHAAKELLSVHWAPT